MRSRIILLISGVAVLLGSGLLAAERSKREERNLDSVLAKENADRPTSVAPAIDDWQFLRRVTIDLIGRIPADQEISEFFALPEETRRSAWVDRLLKDPRFADRWTVFFADMLRIRGEASGGQQFLAFVHTAVEADMPYDEMCRQLIISSGKPTKNPAVGFVLGDYADPMALAGATAQVFLGTRIACAQCHNHPFDKWKREQFYQLAAYFGRVQRVQSPVSQRVYATEGDESMVLWPPPEEANGKDPKPMPAQFPFDMDKGDRPTRPIARLTALRKRAAQEQVAAKEQNVGSEESIEELVAKAAQEGAGSLDGTAGPLDEIVSQSKRDAKDLKVGQDLYRTSDLRRELANQITDPRNRLFSRALVNRVWKELMGRGFVEPVDDFSDKNTPSHPETLDYLADEFVAQGYNLRKLIHMIVTSETYQRGHLASKDAEAEKLAEQSFNAVGLRRMISEVLFDSIVQAGHLSTPKYAPGDNVRTVRHLVRVEVDKEKEGQSTDEIAKIKPDKSGANGKGQKMPAMVAVSSGGYDLESATAIDFSSVLTDDGEDDDGLQMEKMMPVSREQLEAEMMMEKMEQERGRTYVERYVEVQVDDNPVFESAMRMVTPAPPSHFLRIFGQPARDALGDHRDDSPSMRQALLMLNGRLTHEASRVGTLEPMHQLVTGKKANPAAAIRLAYREILTRNPDPQEQQDGQDILKSAASLAEGIADLRWVLLNSNEFRYLP